jgi:hypothetical protein
MVVRVLSALAFGAGVLLLGAAFLGYLGFLNPSLGPTEPAPRLLITPATEFEGLSGIAGEETCITVRLVNTSSAVVTIVGISEC